MREREEEDETGVGCCGLTTTIFLVTFCYLQTLCLKKEKNRIEMGSCCDSTDCNLYVLRHHDLCSGFTFLCRTG